MSASDWLLLASWAIWSWHYVHTTGKMDKLAKAPPAPSAFDETASKALRKMLDAERFVPRCMTVQGHAYFTYKGERMRMTIERDRV